MFEKNTAAGNISKNTASEKCELLTEGTSSRSHSSFAKGLRFLKVYLVVTLLQAPVYAVEPIDANPDPDFPPPPQTIVVEKSEQLEIETLPPGHYRIILVDGDGQTQTFEIRIQ